MGPKVEACLRFVDAGGESVIASLTEVGPAMAGAAGTHIVPDAPAKGRAAKKPGARSAGKTGAAPAKPRAASKASEKKKRSAPGADVIDINTARRRASAD
jgi:hypothetical protein